MVQGRAYPEGRSICHIPQSGRHRDICATEQDSKPTGEGGMIFWHYGPLWTEEGAWMAYVCMSFGNEGARGLTDCEWIIPGTAKP
jgi:hypothetical protein